MLADEMTGKRLLKKVEFAKACNINPSTVTRLIQGELFDALQGKLIDVGHPLVVDYMARHEIIMPPVAPGAPEKVIAAAADAPTKKGPPVTSPTRLSRPEKEKPEKTIITVQDQAGDELLVNLMELTVGEIVEKYGSTSGFTAYLDMAKKREEILEKRLKNRKTSDESISRDFVRKYVFSTFESLFNRLLNDHPQTVTNRIIEAYEAGETKEHCTEITTQLISKQLQDAKRRIIEALDSDTK